MKIENCKLKIAKREGFTLIEIIVVMAIIGILAATAMVNFGKNEDRDVRMEKDRFTSFLREVQNKALTAERSGLTPTGKICGFGIYFIDSKTVQVYYIETTTDIFKYKLDVSCSDDLNVSKRHFSSSNSIVADIPSDTFIFKNSVTVNGALPEEIFFLTPSGEIYYGGVKVSVPSINLIKGSITPIPVNIDQSGRIY